MTGLGYIHRKLSYEKKHLKAVISFCKMGSRRHKYMTSARNIPQKMCKIFNDII